MPVIAWILVSGILMTALAAVGAVTLYLKESTLQRVISPLVAFAGGSLLGGAFFHMIPASIDEMGTGISVPIWIMAGFCAFLALEQFLHWHHCRQEFDDCRRPLTFVLLAGDVLHHFIAGLAVASAFMIDIRLGLTTWFAEAVHEVPRELGDYAVLLHGGWDKKRALIVNTLSAASFPLGGVIAYAASTNLNVAPLVPLAAGNFIYIAASDLVPEVNKHHELKANIIHFFAFLAGLALLLTVKITMD